MFTSLVAEWSLPCREDLIAQSVSEHQFIHSTSTDFDDPTSVATTDVPTKAQILLPYPIHCKAHDSSPDGVKLRIENPERRSKTLLSIPVQPVEPARLQLRLVDDATLKSSKNVAGRITVQCSDGVCRYRGKYGTRNGRTFTTSGPLLFLEINDSNIGDNIFTGAEIQP